MPCFLVCQAGTLWALVPAREAARWPPWEFVLIGPKVSSHYLIWVPEKRASFLLLAHHGRLLFPQSISRKVQNSLFLDAMYDNTVRILG